MRLKNTFEQELEQTNWFRCLVIGIQSLNIRFGERFGTLKISIGPIRVRSLVVQLNFRQAKISPIQNFAKQNFRQTNISPNKNSAKFNFRQIYISPEKNLLEMNFLKSLLELLF